MSIAFCFLVKDIIEHENVWNKFFQNVPKNKYNIYSHPKILGNLPTWITENTVKTIDTEWCGESLVFALILMLKEALKNKNNKYFILVSGSCIPLYNFDYIYNTLFKLKKTIINYTQYTTNEGYKYFYADQWIIFNKKTANLMLELPLYLDILRYEYLSDKKIGSKHCPDEIYIIFYFLFMLDKNFNKNIKKQVVTFTKWKKGASSPKILSTRMTSYKELCSSNALFARKFNSDSATKYGLSCSNYKQRSYKRH